MDNCAAVPWTSTTLGAVATRLVNGGTPPTEEQAYWTGGLPWITGADFTQSGVGEFRRFVSEEAIKRTATNIVDKGSLLIVTRTGVGKLAIAPCDIAISQDITGVYPDRDQVDVEFLYHRMRQGVDDLRKLNQGTSINGIVRKDLISYSFELPPLNQQRRIANILSTVDQAIDQTEALIAKQQRIKTGLMQDLLTRGIDENGNLRSEETHEFKDSPLGRIPAEWKVRNIDSISYFVTSGARGWAKYYSDEGAVFLRIGNLTHAHINMRFDDTVFVRPPDSAEGLRTLVAPGDVLISVTADLGIIGVIPEGFGEGYVNQHIALVRISDPEVDQRFIGWFLQSRAGQAQFERHNESGAKAGLNLPTIRSILVASPPLGEQRHIAKMLDANAEGISRFQAELNKQSHLKTALMQDLLTGKVSVAPLLTDAEGDA